MNTEFNFIELANATTKHIEKLKGDLVKYGGTQPLTMIGV